MNLLNAGEYIQSFLKIRTKDNEVIPFRFNPPQQRLYQVIREQWMAGKPVRIIILKARQMGFSTLTEAIIFWMAVTACFVECMIVAHKEEATANLFRMSKRYYELLPAALKPMMQASNAQELVFDKPPKAKGKARGLGSRIRCATAGGSGVGRSYTLKAVHASEFAFWPGDKLETLSGLVQAVPDRPGTLIVIESTANGYNEFKTLWDDAVKAQREGTDGYIPVFFAWYEMPEYRRTPLPGFRRTPEEEELAATFGLDDEQLAWRRWCIATQCQGDIDTFRQEYPSSPDEAFIATGRCVFDKPSLVLRRRQVEKTPWKRGQFRIEYGIDGKILSWKWEEDPKGPVRIRVHPEKGVPYVFGGDTAGTGSDYFAGHVLDNRTGEQVAVLHHRYSEREFARQVYCLGMYYNEALLGIETNYSTYPQLMLEDLGYRNFYVRTVLDKYTKEPTKSFGFLTTGKSRPAAIDGLKDVAKYDLDLIHDYDTLGEMLVFIYDDEFRPQAENGEHDDLVMSLAIAHFIRPQQRAVKLEQEPEGREWTASMWEDYRNAGPSDKQLLLRKWGRPKPRR